MSFEQNSTLNSNQLKQKRFVAEFTITANATPASKVHGVPDVPGVMLLRTEGIVAAADAVEDLSGDFATANDEDSGNCTFGVLIRGGDEGLGSIKKVLSIRLFEGTALATSMAITRLGTRGLTAGGNIAFDVVGTGLRLDTESPRITVEVEYLCD